MPKQTPFHSRTAPLNQTGIWKNWAGYLVVPQYQFSETEEYYLVRNSVGLLDTSPLYKYRFSGTDSHELLRRTLARDIATCDIGTAQYTCWCNEAGFVIQDGVVMRLDQDEYWLTSAEPSLRYFRQLARQFRLAQVEVADESETHGLLALQGPHAYDTIAQLTDAADGMCYFTATRTKIAGADVILSRTGFTGDLGYEVLMATDDAVAVWDAIVRAGANFNLSPLGTLPLKIARVEAGLLLMDVDFHSARYAWVDAQRETPVELGWSWMFRNLASDGRDFVGRLAIESQLKDQSARWTTVGLEIDWHDYERVHVEAGIMSPKHAVYRESTFSIYRRNDIPWDYAGYATSMLYSSLLHRPIAIAKLPLDLTRPGTCVDIEINVIRKPVNVIARVAPMPFFNPKRKTARMES